MTIKRTIHGDKEQIINMLRKEADESRDIAERSAATKLFEERQHGRADGIEWAIHVIEDWEEA